MNTKDDLFWLLSAQVYSIKSWIKNSFLALDSSRRPFVHFLNMIKLCVVYFLFFFRIMRKQQSSFQWVAHDAVRTTLLHVGGVSLDVPGTLMQAGGREGGKEGSKEGNWNGQHFLCWDVAVGWILNADYCSPTFGWSKVRELDSQGINESAVLSRLRTCVQ